MAELKISFDKGPVDRIAIEGFAKSCGKKFPSTYIDLLSKHDYLYLDNDTFDFIDHYGKKETSSIAFLGYKMEEYSSENIYSSFYPEREYGYGTKVIVFGRDGGGSYICFDYRENPNTDNPPIVFMWHDDYIEFEDGSAKMAINCLAPNFDAFLEMLYEYTDEDFERDMQNSSE